MRHLFLTIFLFLVCIVGVFAQFADPAVSGANFVPNETSVGQKAVLSISFANSGSTPIPANSIELTISTAKDYYKSDGTTAPSGAGGALFTWTYVGADVWRGTNSSAVPAFGGGIITLSVSGIAISPSFETTNVNVQPVANFGAFNNAATNDNLQPKLRVIAAPSLPVAVNDNSTTSQNTAVTIPVLTNDNLNGGTSPVVSIVTPSPNGTATVSGNQIVFTPTTGFSGTTTLTYKITASNGVSNIATVTIIVDAPVVIAPVAVNDNSTTPHNTTVTIPVLTNDNLNGGTSPVVSIVTPSPNGTATVSGNQIVFTPTTGFSGTTTLTYKITASNGVSNIATVTIVVDAPVVIAPVAVNDNSRTPQNTAVTIPVLTNDNLNGGTSPVVSVVTPSPNGTATVSGNQIVFTPTTGFSGTTTLTYKITASNGMSNIATVTVVVTPVNTNDICTNSAANIIGGAGVVKITGITTSAAVIQIFNETFTGSVYNQQISSSSVDVTLPAGKYNVKVTVLGAGGTYPSVCEVIEPVTVTGGTVTPPTAVNDNGSTLQNTSITIPVLTNDNLNGGTSPVVSVVTPSPNGTATVSGNQIVFTPTTGFSGTTTLTYKITASNGVSNIATVTIIVNAPVVVAPIAVNDNSTTPQNTAVTIPILTNDNLNGGTSPVVSVVTPSPNGTATVSGNQIVFTPTTGFSGTTTLTYKITASNGVSNIATVTIVVTAVNTNDICTNPNSNVVGGAGIINITGITTSAAIIQVFTSNWSSVYNQQVSASSVSIPNLPAGTYYVKITVLGQGGQWPAVCDKMVTVTVTTGGNTNPPIANNDNATTLQNTAVTITPLSNDVINGTLQNIAIKSQPANGSAVLNGNNIVFTPATGFTGTTSLSYCFTTSSGTSNTATITVSVTAPSINCNAVRNNSISKSCSGNTTVLTGTNLPGYEYMWLQSTTACPNDGSQGIPGAAGMGVNYTLPSAVTVTTYFSRCARPIGCTTWGAVTESNCITVYPTDCSPALSGCEAVVVSGTNNGVINISGLGTYTSQILVFNSQWQPVSNLSYNVPSTSISVKNGSYFVKIQLYNTVGRWQFVCEKIFNVSVTGAANLAIKPIALDIDAFADVNRAQIQWINNSGSKNDYFIVEKLNLTTGNFETIGNVNSKKSDVNELYTTYDNSPIEGDNVYRVKLNMLDGTTKTSVIKTLNYSSVNDVRLFPNPATDYIEVDLKQYNNKAVQLYMYNNLGQLILTQAVEKASNTPVHLDLNSKISGSYILRITSQGKKDLIKKFVIQQ